MATLFGSGGFRSTDGGGYPLAGWCPALSDREWARIVNLSCMGVRAA